MGERLETPGAARVGFNFEVGERQDLPLPTGNRLQSAGVSLR